MGYIGLPTAVFLATNGYRVVGVDINQSLVDQINRGECYPEPGLEELLQRALAGGSLRASVQVEKADVFIVAVPTPKLADGQADLSFVRAAGESIASVLEKGNLVVLESTSPPRTTEEVLRPVLQERSGLRAGTDFYLAHCPEKVLPGQIVQEMQHNDRIVGGIDSRSTGLAVRLYRSFCKAELIETDATTAEMAKLIENTYRMVNIALANELAKVSEYLGINVWEAIALANRHPRVNLHQPGPGVGGHCIPVDPWFIVGVAPALTPLIRTAGELNRSMVDHVVARTIELLPHTQGAPRVAAFGLAYKPDTDDMRASSAELIVEELRRRGVEVRAVDPMVSNTATVPVDEAVRGADLVLLLVNHSAFASLDPDAIRSQMRRPVLYDTRNCLQRSAWEAAGFFVQVLGHGEVQHVVDAAKLAAVASDS